MKLYEDQEKALEDIRASFRSGKKRPVFYAPTGFGKSTCLSVMLKRTPHKTLILVHRIELLAQVSKNLTRQGIGHGCISPAHERTDHQIQVGMQQTVSRRLSSLPDFGLIVSDEVHLAMSAGWLKILRHYERAFHLGLSGSPTRLDGKGLGDFFDDLVPGPSVRQLMAAGRLVTCRVFAPAEKPYAGKKLAGEFSLAEAAEAMSGSIVGDAVTEWRKHACGRKTIIFCSGVKHSEEVASEFRAAGISAENVDGSMDKNIRKNRIDDFRTGCVQILCNVDLLSTGFDCPDVSCVIFMRPTASLVFFVQAIGRGLRTANGKSDCILIDMAANTLRHGLPCDDRQWSLDGKTARDKDAAVSIVRCPECFAVMKPVRACIECGAVLAVAKKPRKIERRDGELSEVDLAAKRERMAELATKPLAEVLRRGMSYSEIDEVRAARGYARGWAFYKWQELRA